VRRRHSKVELPHTLETAIQDYFDWADDFLRKVERRSKIAAPLYHYTDMRGLTGILTNEEIWFTDYRHVNDPKELLHGIALANAMLQRRINDGGFVKFLYGWIDDLLTQKNFGRALEFFIASFSRRRDELGQWRAYADDGRGVAIGFSPRLFAATDAKNSEPSKNSYVGPVFYKDSQTRARHAKGLDKAARMLDDALRYARRHLRDKKIGMGFLNQLARAVVAAPLLWNALTCKHPAYEHEAEVRMIILGEKKKFKGKISKRTRNGRVVPYIPRRLPLRERGNIAEIVIGPAAPKGAERDIRKLIKSLGMDSKIPVRRSRIPYRSV
jgi:hypothetical protein